MVNATFFSFKHLIEPPNEYYYVSHVAVDRENLEAVLLIGNYCGVLCAYERLIHIKKYGLQWRLVSGELLFVS